MMAPATAWSAVSPEQYQAALAADAYWRGRWPYLAVAGALLRRNLDAATPPGDVLEVGPHSLAMVRGSRVMDLTCRVTPPDASAVCRHDAARAPWPYGDGELSCVVALQVWEHLGGDQPRAFAEAMRVARTALLSVPYRWPATSRSGHGGIDRGVVGEWTLGVDPVETVRVGPAGSERLLLFWDFARL